MAETADIGVAVQLSDIEIRQEVIEVCEVLDVNPYMLYTEGVFLIVTENGNHVVHKFAENGFEAAVIGYTHSGADRVVINDGETRFLEARIVDEIKRFV